MDGDHPLRRLADALLLAQLHRPDDERLAVGLDLERCVLRDAEQLEDRALDDEPEAVANCGELKLFALCDRGTDLPDCIALAPTAHGDRVPGEAPRGG